MAAYEWHKQATIPYISDELALMMASRNWHVERASENVLTIRGAQDRLFRVVIDEVENIERTVLN